MRYWLDHPVASAFGLALAVSVLVGSTSLDPVASIGEAGMRQALYLGVGAMLAATFAGCITAAALVFSLSDRGRVAVALRYHSSSLISVLFVDLLLILSASTTATISAAFDSEPLPSAARHVVAFALVAGLVGTVHIGHLLMQLLSMELADRHDREDPDPI